MAFLSKLIILFWVFLISLSQALLAQQKEYFSGNMIFEMNALEDIGEDENNTIGKTCDSSGLAKILSK